LLVSDVIPSIRSIARNKNILFLFVCFPNSLCFTFFLTTKSKKKARTNDNFSKRRKNPIVEEEEEIFPRGVSPGRDESETPTRIQNPPDRKMTRASFHREVQCTWKMDAGVSFFLRKASSSFLSLSLLSFIRSSRDRAAFEGGKKETRRKLFF